MGKLTTHVLDTAAGIPGKGIRIDLYQLSDGRRALIDTRVTNADGRCDAPILEGQNFKRGKYELVFHMGSYFDTTGIELQEPKFLDDIVLRFGISDADEHYHVPLLVSPYSYSTYRGS
ncbi:MAG: hydroxyisourate hydrolase [Sneathiella sp.]|nr:hydroxyisourate hydrolase [Sneathiella sp.]